MHKADIKAALEKKGETGNGFARLHGFPDGALTECLRVGRPSVEKALSDFLDLPLSTLFPERYSRENQRLDPRTWRKNTTKPKAKASRKKRVQKA